MEEIKVNGIVLSTIDYGEKDALVSLFTVELGKISVKMKGVKGDKAKFKYACQSFCFGEWVCARRGDYYTVISFTLIDNFYELTLDYNKYVICNTYLEMCDKFLKPNIISEKLFINLLTALKQTVYQDINPYLVAVKFCLETITIMGYGLTFGNCFSCGMPIKSDIYLSAITNDFSCVPCCNRNGQLVSRELYNTLKILSQTPFEKLNTINISESTIKRSLLLLKTDFENLVGVKLVSFSKIEF